MTININLLILKTVLSFFFRNFSVAKSVLFSAIGVAVLLLVISLVDQTDAQCCLMAYSISHVCKGIPNELPLVFRGRGDTGRTKYWAPQDPKSERAKKCRSDFCADGSTADGWYCCVGECWMNGRFCENGCRQGNGTLYMDMQMDWIRKQGFVRQVEHYL